MPNISTTPSSSLPLLTTSSNATIVPYPSAKKPRRPTVEVIPSELGEFIARDVDLLSKFGWTAFVKHRRRRGDFASLNFPHKAAPLLQQIKKHGAPVILSSKPWSNHKLDKAIRRGPHRSCEEYIDFLEEEFIDMIRKEQWVILPYHVANKLPGLQLSPPGVVPQRGCRPGWICNYT